MLSCNKKSIKSGVKKTDLCNFLVMKVDRAPNLSGTHFLICNLRELNKMTFQLLLSMIIIFIFRIS